MHAACFHFCIKFLKVILIETEERLLPGAEDWRKWGRVGQNIQTCSYKVNIFCGCKVQHGDDS
jgi:hypothetical protein